MPGGYDIDRWPIGIPLLGGESLPSWLTAFSARYALSPAEVFALLGAPLVSRSPTTVLAHLGAHHHRLAAVMGWHGQALAEATVSPFDPARTGYLQTYHHLRTAPTGGSRFCPACLTETGGRWQRGWRNPLQVACAAHRVLLCTRCLHCGQVPFSSATWFRQIRTGWCCPEHTGADEHPAHAPSPGDDTDLRCTPTGAVASPELLAAQQLLGELGEQAGATGDVPRWMCGVAATAAIGVDAVLELIDEAVGYRTTMLEGGNDPAVTAAALCVAVRVLEQGTVGQAAAVAEVHGLLNPAGVHTPITPYLRGAQRRRNPLLAAIRIGSLAPSLAPASQLMFRPAADSARYPTAYCAGTGPGQRLPRHARWPEPSPAWIPQILWPGLLTEFPLAEDPVDTAAGLAMALAKLGSARSWALIAVDLGLPAALASQLPMYWQRLIRAGRWPALLTGLETLCQQLQRHPPPIDYQGRRIIADNPRVLVRAVTTAGHYLPAPSPGVPATSLIRRFWELYTGGDVRHAAAPVGLANADRYRSYAQHRHSMTTPHHEQLFAAAFEILNHTVAADDGPLTWSPTEDPGTGTRTWDGPVGAVDLSRAGEALSSPDYHQQVFTGTVLAAAATTRSKAGLRRWVIAYLEDTFGIPPEYAATNVWIDGVCDLAPRVRHGQPLVSSDTSDRSDCHPLRRRLSHTLGPGRRHGGPLPWHPDTFLEG